MKKHSLKDDIGYWINRLRMEVHSSFESKLIVYGITIPQWSLLVAVYNNDGNNVSSLSAFIETDKGFVSRVIEQLVQMELVERKEGKDRRSQEVLLTSKAKVLTAQLIQCANQNEKEFFSILTQREKESLKHILIKLLKNTAVESLGGFLNETIESGKIKGELNE